MPFCVSFNAVIAKRWVTFGCITVFQQAGKIILTNNISAWFPSLSHRPDLSLGKNDLCSKLHVHVCQQTTSLLYSLTFGVWTGCKIIMLIMWFLSALIVSHLFQNYLFEQANHLYISFSLHATPHNTLQSPLIITNHYHFKENKNKHKATAFAPVHLSGAFLWPITRWRSKGLLIY